MRSSNKASLMSTSPAPLCPLSAITCSAQSTQEPAHNDPTEEAANGMAYIFPLCYYLPGSVGRRI